MIRRHMTLNPIAQGGIGLSIISFALAAASSDARAQDAENSIRGSALETVVVTARKRAENLQEVPISIDVFSAADVEAKSLTTLQELSQFTPNFSMYNNGVDGSLTNDVTMRGIGNSLGGPGVGIYLDGVYLSTQQAIDLGMLDVERVELLFGPQGTLFGRNTVGGAVNYISKRPTGEFSGSAQLDVGSNDRLDAKVSLNGPLIPGTLNARLAIGKQTRDGYMKVLDYGTGSQIDELGNRNRWSGRLLVDWIVSDNLNVLFAVEKADLDEKATARTATEMVATSVHRLYNTVFAPTPPWGPSFLSPDLYSTYGTYRDGLDNFNYLRATGGSITVDWNLGENLSFKSISAYREYVTGFGSDFDFSPYYIGAGNNYTDQDQRSQEFQLTGSSFENRFRWVAGLYYFLEHADDPSISLGNTPLIEAGRLADTRRWIHRLSTDESWAAFSEGSFDITDKLTATLGLRYTEEKKTEFSERVDIFEGGHDCISCQLPYYGEEEIDDTSGRANLSYKWTDEVMTYVSAAKGFKSGGLSASVLNVTDTRPTLLQYLPEYVWTYELGIKSTLLDNRLRLNATGFFSDYSDIQYQFFTGVVEGGIPRTISVVSNAGKAEIKGFELQALFEPIESLTLTAGVGRTQGEYTAADQRGGPLTLDSKFLQTPEWSYTLSAEHRMAFGWGDVSARVDYSWRDKVYFDVTNTTNPNLQQEAYGILNANVRFDLSDRWRVTVYGTNLTDEEYIIGAYSLTSSGAPSLVQPALPREWGVSARMSF